ncbi:MAG: efflux transporter outer membrane subunit [Lentisphaerae bacterium]|nr:efflux transporter outer membrane subunit [Lentisphaerota bacterium]
MTCSATRAVRIGWPAAVVLLAGCAAVGPDYQPPEWHEPAAAVPQIEGHAPQDNELASWWHAFNDPTLTRLIRQGLIDNRTLDAARYGVSEARARLRLSRSGLLPMLDAGGANTRFRNSDTAGAPGSGDLYHLGFDAQWELDIFGGRRRAVEAARADWEAEWVAEEGVWVSLAAEIATHYVTLRTDQERLRVARDNLKLQAETAQILESRFETGIGDKLAVEQAHYQLEGTRALIPSLLRDLEATRNALAVLVGAMPGEADAALDAPGPIPAALPRALAAVPAELLRRRPDIRAAERRLAAETARIGEAQAARYPAFRIDGALGLESLASGSLLTSGSRFTTAGAGITLPIFRGGAIRANIEIQNARQEQALARYEVTVLTAVAEWRDALAAYGHEHARREALVKAAVAARAAEEIARDLYANGLIDFNSVLDTQRARLTFDEAVAGSEGAIARNLIRAYKALGGGWAAVEE